MQEWGGWGRVAEEGCCLCGRRLSPARQCGCSVYSAVLTGLSHPCSPRLSCSCSPQGLWLCADTCTLEGHSEQHRGGAQSQCWKCPALSLQPCPQPQGRPEPPIEEPPPVSSGCQCLTALPAGLPCRVGVCACSQPCEHTHTPGALQPSGCWLRLPAQSGRQSQRRHSSACCPKCSCPPGNPKGFHRKIAQSGIYSPTPLWASGFLPASSFPTARST